MVSAAPRVEAIPKKEYPIAPEVGPWVILCASYSGEAATDLAREVAFCLRSRDNLPAYVYNRGAQLRAQQEREIEEIKKQGGKVRRVVIPDDCAVLIGGYPDQDTALDALKKIKKLPPPEVNLGPNVLPYKVLKWEKDSATGKLHAVAINPFSNSVAVPNPTVPVSSARRADPFLKDLNEGESFSLLKNPAPWTLVVQNYTGAISIVPADSSQQLFGREPGPAPIQRNALEAAAKQAHETARVLRELKYDAYVLHTRQASIVAVGGFADGKDPEMVKLAEAMAKDTRLEVIHLIQPMLALEVPRP
jgi:hypothetical protein